MKPKRTTITIKLKTFASSETFKDSLDEHLDQEGKDQDDDQEKQEQDVERQRRGLPLPPGVAPYPEEFDNFLDNCYCLMDEVWRYKRNFEGVEEFWERVVVGPSRRAAELRASGGKSGHPKKSETKLNVLIEILFIFRHLVPAK